MIANLGAPLPSRAGPTTAERLAAAYAAARTMEVNGAVAFGAALAGGALGGPMGAFMALPLAALVTAFILTYGRSYPLAYDSPHDRPPVIGPRAAPERRTIFQRSRR